MRDDESTQVAAILLGRTGLSRSRGMERSDANIVSHLRGGNGPSQGKRNARALVLGGRRRRGRARWRGDFESSAKFSSAATGAASSEGAVFLLRALAVGGLGNPAG